MSVQSLDIISINLWQILISLANLLIMFLILKRFLFKPVQKVMAARQEQVDKMYGEAEEDRTAAAGMKQEYEARLATAREEGNHQATLALEIFDYKVKKYIGSYAAAMGGVDAIVFTGGIGENNKTARNVALEGLEFMGVELDPEKSQQSLKNVDISAPTSRVKVLVIETDEEFVIASDTLELVTAAKA